MVIRHIMESLWVYCSQMEFMLILIYFALLFRAFQYLCDSKTSECEVNNDTSQRQQSLLGAGLPLVSIISFTDFILGCPQLLFLSFS